jgi:shikimate kinase
MPGSGKSTVGRQLARRLQLPFIDLDHRIEAHLGYSIREHFEREGEVAFRDLESAMLAEVLKEPCSVLSTGGGTVIRDVNRQQLRAHSTVFYLRTQPHEIHRRLRNDLNRPLLQVADPMARLRELFQTRDPWYRDAAHHVIELPKPRVSSLIQAVIALLPPELANRATARSDDRASTVSPSVSHDPRTPH